MPKHIARNLLGSLAVIVSSALLVSCGSDSQPDTTSEAAAPTLQNESSSPNTEWLSGAGVILDINRYNAASAIKRRLDEMYRDSCGEQFIGDEYHICMLEANRLVCLEMSSELAEISEDKLDTERAFNYHREIVSACITACSDWENWKTHRSVSDWFSEERCQEIDDYHNWLYGLDVN